MIPIHLLIMSLAPAAKAVGEFVTKKIDEQKENSKVSKITESRREIQVESPKEPPKTKPLINKPSSGLDQISLNIRNHRSEHIKKR